jgi:hypothetical protein
MLQAMEALTMKTIELRATVAEDGTLTIRLPPDVPPGEHDLVLVIDQPQRPAHGMKPAPEQLGWPPDFFEKVVGAWKGEPLQRPEQGPYEIREDLP